MRRALALTFFADIAQGIFVVMFIVFVARRLHGGAGETGLLRGVQALGAIAAGLMLATVGRRSTPARLTAAAALSFGAISLLVWNLPGLTTAPAVYAVLFAVVGAPGVMMANRGSGPSSTRRRASIWRPGCWRSVRWKGPRGQGHRKPFV